MLPTPRGSAAPGRELLRPVLGAMPWPQVLVGPTSTCERHRTCLPGGLAKKLDMDDSEVIATS